MANNKKLSVKVRRISEDKKTCFIGPERVDGELFEVKTEDLSHVISSINSDHSDSDKLSQLLALHIQSAAFDTPRPIEDGTVWEVIRSHTPEDVWPSFTYFSPPVLETIQWHVALNSPQIQELIKDGILEIIFDQ